MLEALRQFKNDLEAFKRRLQKISALHLNVAADKEEAQRIVDTYFRNVREQFRLGGFTAQRLSTADALMQTLLQLSHHRSPVASYKTVCSEILRELFTLERDTLLISKTEETPQIKDPADRQIISTLTSLLPSAARSYQQAILDLAGPERLSWRGPATDLREALRETLDHLAPDKEVVSQPGFRLEKDTSGPTMKQKVRHVLKSRGKGKSETAPPESAAEAIEEVVGGFVRSVYTRSSVSTHTPTDRSEVLRIRDWVRVTLAELLSITV